MSGNYGILEIGEFANKDVIQPRRPRVPAMKAIFDSTLIVSMPLGGAGKK